MDEEERQAIRCFWLAELVIDLLLLNFNERHLDGNVVGLSPERNSQHFNTRASGIGLDSEARR